mmetsp:Transcript_8716/g.14117  ORF Transcript_8716/g.14117 Transcript_8716/m.14117 type:complete len:373 (+) Transcript_8716:301-1419(+)
MWCADMMGSLGLLLMFVSLPSLSGCSQVCDVELPISETMCGLVAYFNPAKFQSRYDNFVKFRERSKAQGLWLLVVEMAFGEHEFELEHGIHADGLIQIRGDETSVLWQKERLLNIGLGSLPRGVCKSIVWPDAEVLFDNDDWVGETILALEKYPVIQPYEYAVRLRRGEVWVDAKDLRPSLDKGEGIKTRGIAKSMFRKKRTRAILNSQRKHGYTGFAWAARRQALEDFGGFYDKNIVGGADGLMAHAFFGNLRDKAYIPYFYENRVIPQVYEDWSHEAFRVVQGDVGHVPGSVLHLWHGDKKDRQYVDRHKLLLEAGFDPSVDLDRRRCVVGLHAPPELDVSSCFVWALSTRSRVNLAALLSMFENRREDK